MGIAAAPDVRDAATQLAHDLRIGFEPVGRGTLIIIQMHAADHAIGKTQPDLGGVLHLQIQVAKLP